MQFGGVRALHQVSLELQTGSVRGLIGPNGSGKTTLLNCMSGVLRPTGGTVTLRDADVSHEGPAQIARLGVARTFQNIRLFERLTVRENIEVNGLAAGRLHRHSARMAALELAEEFGVADVCEQYASELSYGHRRRVEIARALASQPDFLLLDEPTAGMNSEETAELGELIQNIRRNRGCGILMIDHDLELIVAHCDEITVLNEGEMIAHGKPAEIQSDPAVVTAYIGEELSHAPT
jgi:ABC-type branched-subunit amino acid transport system ATPase component